jgi:hypothetical protein
VLGCILSSAFKKGLGLVLSAAFLTLNSAALEFSLKLKAGWVRMNGGDLNKSISGWERYYQDRQSSSFSVSDTVREIHATYEAGLEALVRLRPRWSVGLGMTICAFSREGEISTNLTTQQDYTVSPSGSGTISLEEATSQSPLYELRVIPVTLSVYYLLPLGSKYSLCLGAGAGLYLGQYSYKEAYSYSFDYVDTHISGNKQVQYVDRSSSAGDYSETAAAQAFGFHASVALDVRLSPSLSLTVEVLGRRANIDGWSGDGTDSYDWNHSWGPWGAYSDSGHVDESNSGKLWRVDVPSSETGKLYPRVVFSDEEPVSAEYTETRPASISLNGLSLRAGIKLKFGRTG